MIVATFSSPSVQMQSDPTLTACFCVKWSNNLQKSRLLVSRCIPARPCHQVARLPLFLASNNVHLSIAQLLSGISQAGKNREKVKKITLLERVLDTFWSIAISQESRPSLHVFAFTKAVMKTQRIKYWWVWITGRVTDGNTAGIPIAWTSY